MMLMLLEIAAFASEEGGHGGFTMTDFWNAAGPEAKGVIVTLALLTIICIFVWIERMLAFTSARRQTLAVQKAISQPMVQGEVSKALKIAGDEAYKNSYLAQMLRAGLAELDANPNDFGVKNAERAVEREIELQTTKLKKRFVWLATTGSTAPFVGLFGTTFGVINTFSQMGGGGGLAEISGGISEALYTTAIGIGVAIIGVWLFNFFNGKLESVTNDLSSSEAEFLDWAAKLVHSRQHAAK